MLVSFEHARWERAFSAKRGRADVVICDPEYDLADHSYIAAAAEWLRPGGALWVFGDAGSIAQTKISIDLVGEFDFQNWIIWPNDWGGRSKRRFGQKHDDILYYTKRGGEWTFNAAAIEIPKLMTMVAFNPSGRTHKIPSSVWTDLAGFSTMAKERVKIDGHCVRWQKPEKVIERIVRATSNVGDLVFDPFGGVATVPLVCGRLARLCISTEADEKVWRAGTERLSGL